MSFMIWYEALCRLHQEEAQSSLGSGSVKEAVASPVYGEEMRKLLLDRIDSERRLKSE